MQTVAPPSPGGVPLSFQCSPSLQVASPDQKLRGRAEDGESRLKVSYFQDLWPAPASCRQPWHPNIPAWKSCRPQCATRVRLARRQVKVKANHSKWRKARCNWAAFKLVRKLTSSSSGGGSGEYCVDLLSRPLTKPSLGCSNCLNPSGSRLVAIQERERRTQQQEGRCGKLSLSLGGPGPATGFWSSGYGHEVILTRPQRIPFTPGKLNPFALCRQDSQTPICRLTTHWENKRQFPDLTPRSDFKEVGEKAHHHSLTAVL